MGRVGQFTIKDAVSQHISQLPDNPYVGLSRNSRYNSRSAWMRNRYGNKSQTIISQWWHKCVVSDKAAWATLSCDAGVPSAYKLGGTGESYDAGIRFFNLVCDAAGRAFGRKGIQPQVPSPGENQKKVVYGGVDYTTGRITYTVAATKSGYNFLAFLIVLVKAYAGRKIRLVCDNGRERFRNGYMPINRLSRYSGCRLIAPA
jgi:hypothetical protein